MIIEKVLLEDMIKKYDMNAPKSSKFGSLDINLHSIEQRHLELKEEIKRAKRAAMLLNSIYNQYTYILECERDKDLSK